MKLDINIIGAYHSKFGVLKEESLYSLYATALKKVVEDADIAPASIDGIFVGNYSGGSFNNQENIAPYAVNVLPELRHKPCYRVETACTSGSSAIHMAAMAIQAGMMNRVVVVGLEKMNSLNIEGVTDTLAKATFWPEEGARHVTAPCMFADLANGWMEEHGIPADKLRTYLAKIAAKAYTNAASNPLAQLRRERTPEEILSLPDEKNPMIHDPLRLHDCSLVSDGAAAIVLEKADFSSTSESVHLSSFHNASDYLDSFGKHKSNSFLEGAAYAIDKALTSCKMKLSDMDLAEVHDCFTITELLHYSALGLTRAGREFEALEDGSVGPAGKLPVNLSGGLKAKGHPIGATGVAMHAYLYKQLIGEAYNLQVKDANKGILVNIGGSGTSNAVSVLERIR